MIKPTQEQEDIISAFKSNRVLKVNAVAGSGKSSTLRMLAEANPVNSLYICLNKVIAEEASGKFPDHVDCRTTHSVAFATYGKMIMHKLKRPSVYRNVAGTSSEIAKYYSIQDIDITPDEKIKSTSIASFAKSTVNSYQNSADIHISSNHIPWYGLKKLEKTHPSINLKYLSSIVLSVANKLWKDRVNPSSTVLATHDTYLKLWQLSKPVLNYDIIYIDEAQDSNPAVLDVVQRQTQSKIVFVGDTYQSIYQFRGAVNAMDIIQAPTKLLSKSFRYGQEIADLASFIISGAIDVKGCCGIDSQVLNKYPVEDKYTYIFRTNGYLIDKAVELVQQGKSVFCEVDTSNFIKQLDSAMALRMKELNKVKHEDITPYSNWIELKESAKDDPELMRLAKIIESNRYSDVVSCLSNLNTRVSADITLTTAHKSKGKEWNTVVIADDFQLSDKDNILEDLPEAEINLLYVACTRAINKLYICTKLAEGYYGR